MELQSMIYLILLIISAILFSLLLKRQKRKKPNTDTLGIPATLVLLCYAAFLVLYDGFQFRLYHESPLLLLADAAVLASSLLIYLSQQNFLRLTGFRFVSNLFLFLIVSLEIILSGCLEERPGWLSHSYFIAVCISILFIMGNNFINNRKPLSRDKSDQDLK